MLNEQEYDHVPLELPNVVFAYKRISADRTPTITHPFFAPLITKIAKAKPKWKLVGTHKAYRSESPDWVSRFTVIENGQALGDIGISYNYGANTNVVTIDNKRMSDKRQRGLDTRTKDLSRAYKIIIKEFYPKTTEELLGEAKGELGSLITGKFSGANNQRAWATSKVFNHANKYALAHWGDYEKFLLEHGVTVEQIEKYHTAVGETEALTTVYSPFHAEEGYTVVVRAVDYLVFGKGGAKSYTQPELPTYFRTKIGMLQLVEDGSVIPNVGARVSDTILYVVPEEKKGE